MTTLPAAAPLPRIQVGPRSVGWWGMLVLICNEAALFGALLAAYFYVRVNAPAWPVGGLEPPELLIPSLNTVLLILSSVCFIWAEHGVEHGHPGRLKLGLVLTFLLGAGFLGLQAYEYATSPFGPQVNAYSSLFFTITGLHGTHVFVGLVMLGVLIVRAWLGHFDQRRYLAVQSVALYWHFVDVVWLFVFSSLYLSAHL
jgi:heme/copper-type cytochrome/quinol oxidase subunit 3